MVTAMSMGKHKVVPAFEWAHGDEGSSALRAELARARALCRAWSQNVPEMQRAPLAALFTRAALEAFASRLSPTLILSPPFANLSDKLDHAAELLARAVGEDAAGLPLVEGLHFVTSLYPALLPERQRGEMGAFYTPPCLVTRLLDQASEHGIDWTTAKVLDPAAGAGAFLIQAALRMQTALMKCEPALALRHIAGRLLGLELDPVAAGLAQVALEIVLHDLADRAQARLPRIVRVCDTLEESPDASYALVVGNPPYGRIALMPDQRARFARSLYGHANLYGVFTDIALRWTRPGGLVAYLTPTSFLAGQYYSALRRLLAAQAPPIAIDFVNARRGVFEDVLQETLLAIYRKDGDRRRVQVHYLNVQNEREADVVANGMVALPADSGAPWLAPRSPEHGKLIARVEGMTSRLRDWGYTVSTGPLVWNRFKTQLSTEKTDSSTHPLIWAECVTSDGRFVFRALKKNHSPYFRLEAGDGWLLVDQPCVLVQRTTAKEQTRRLIAAELPEDFVRAHHGVVVENHLNMVRSTGKPRVTPSAVAALLNSAVVDQVFRCMNGSVAVSAFELEALPLPDATALEALEILVARGAAAAEISAECQRLYDDRDI